MGPASDEIAKIERELDILRTRYATFGRWARIMQWFFLSLAVAIAASIVSYGIARDSLVAVGIAIAIVVIAGGAYLAYLISDTGIRWIDLAAPGIDYAKRSEAAAIEVMIADREARLAKIRDEQT